MRRIALAIPVAVALLAPLFGPAARGESAMAPGKPEAGMAGLLADSPEGTMVGLFAGALRSRSSWSDTVLIDPVATGGFILFRGDASLELSVRSPSGRTIRRAGASERGIEWDESDAVFVPGKAQSLAIERPEPGAWIVEVTSGILPDSLPMAPYMLWAMVTGGKIALQVDTTPGSATAGDSLVLVAGLTDDGRPVRGARVTARGGIVDPAGRDSSDIHEFPLRDDGIPPDSASGDGRYTARILDTFRPGLYSVSVEAERAPGTAPAFHRLGTSGAVIMPRLGRATGRIEAQARDRNARGLYNSLEVAVDVEILTPGTYRVTATVADPAGRKHWARTAAAARYERGVHRLSFVFQGAEMYDPALRGPLTLQKLLITDVSENEYSTTDQGLDPDLRTPNTLDFSKFEH